MKELIIVITVFLFYIYFAQIIITLILLSSGEFKTKKKFYAQLIPIYPWVISIRKALTESFNKLR